MDERRWTIYGELERLRAALAEVADAPDGRAQQIARAVLQGRIVSDEPELSASWRGSYQAMRDRARAALQGGTTDGRGGGGDFVGAVQRSWRQLAGGTRYVGAGEGEAPPTGRGGHRWLLTTPQC